MRKMAVKSVTSTSELRLQLEVPPGISIALDLSEGRGIVSTQTFPKGSEIFTGLPFCHAVRTNRHDDICTSCLSLSSTWLAVVLCIILYKRLNFILILENWYAYRFVLRIVVRVPR